MSSFEEMPYSRIEHNQLLSLLRTDEIASALCYMATFIDEHKFQVNAHKHCITIKTDQVLIAVIFFVGFETNEYDLLRLLPNLHLVTFSTILPTMVEFEGLGVKYVDNVALMNTVLSRSDDYYLRRMNDLKNLNL